MIIEVRNVLRLQGKDKEKIEEAVFKGNLVLNSSLLLNNWMNLSTCNENNVGKRKNLSQKEVFLFITTYSLKIKIDIVGFYEASNTVGWTRVGTWVTHINRKYLGFYSPADVYGHINHEMSHMMGFLHKKWWGKSKTVPYKWGRCNRDSFKQYYAPLDQPEKNLAEHLFGNEMKLAIVS